MEAAKRVPGEPCQSRGAGHHRAAVFVQAAARTLSSEAGFTLVTVIWVVGLLALIVTAFLVTTRTQVHIAANAERNAEALAMAEAGINLAILDLVSEKGAPITAHRFPTDGTPVQCARGREAALAIAVSDEGGKIDLNAASIQLIERALAGLGLDRTAASRIAESIADFRDPDDLRRLNGAEKDEYRRAGLGRGPKDGPFDAIEELGQVLGMTPELAERLGPLVTVYSGSQGIDPAVAPMTLLRALSGEPAGGGLGGLQQGRAAIAVPPDMVIASRGTVFTIRASASTEAGAMATSEAIVALPSGGGIAYRIRRWTRRADQPVSGVPAGGASGIMAGLPPC